MQDFVHQQYYRGLIQALISYYPYSNPSGALLKGTLFFVIIIIIKAPILGGGRSATASTAEFGASVFGWIGWTRSCKWGYKPPNMGYNHSCSTCNLQLPMNL